MADNDPQSPRDLSRFTLADKLALQMEDMGERIDDLEKRVNGLLAQAGVENPTEELTP